MIYGFGLSFGFLYRLFSKLQFARARTSTEERCDTRLFGLLFFKVSDEGTENVLLSVGHEQFEQRFHWANQGVFEVVHDVNLVLQTVLNNIRRVLRLFKL